MTTTPNTYVVEKTTATPPLPNARNEGGRKYPFETMGVKESFVIPHHGNPEKIRTNVRASWRVHKARGSKWKNQQFCSVVEEENIRVWRIK